jgi:antitoxin component YwqK of YwqJK toxin-antitoxin module
MSWNVFNKQKLWTIIAILTLPACGYLQSRENETSAPTGSTIEGKKQGEWKKYYLNGRLARIENYYNDTLHGKFFSYAPDGILRARGIYKMGVIVDFFCTYNGNGTVNLQEWRDSTGKAQGVFRIYHRNGQLSQIGYHKDGYLDDTSKSFHPNGQPRSIEVYKDNKKSGTWQYFSEKGKLISTEVYENDVLVSKTR